ncbi:MFS transporter [Dactylosporangium fulvum]|uniref:MFS transporter n=1 Tax=Dactylosporangium fulvum TaxID=53359 RepID=A0ABY5W5H0_9ACTN|nr:MFS transporter [Dactylosporangium fulvum]UWP84620.1 MFS transporter [Dactylosporangium fulvum]
MSNDVGGSRASIAPDISGKSASVPPDPKRWIALAIIAIAQLMVVLDATIVNIALPSAQEALDISTADRQWIITAYTLTFGGLLLLGGRIADFFGRKRTLLIGLLGFAGASALGGAAVNAGTLFAARGLQGLFGALLAPAALSLITVTFTEARERAKAFGVFGAIAGGGAAIGLLAGGLLTEYANWRWCLLVNIPIALIAFFAAMPVVRESRAHGDTRYDIPGAILATAGQIALVYGFTKAADDGWSSGVTIGWLAGAVVLLGAFLWWESHTSHPLLPLRVLFDRNRGASYLVSILLGAGMLGMFLFMTFYLQQTMGYSALKSGVAYLPFSGGIIAAAVIASRLLPRVGPKVLMSIGSVLATAAMIWLTQLDLDSSYAVHILPSFVAMSFGMGLVFVPLSSVALSGVANHDAGVASAMVNTTQQVGGSLGTALLNTIFTTAVTGYLADHGTGPLEQAHAAIHGYNVAFTASAILLAAAAVLVVVLVRNTAADRTAGAEEQVPVMVH